MEAVPSPRSLLHPRGVRGTPPPTERRPRSLLSTARRSLAALNASRMSRLSACDSGKGSISSGAPGLAAW